MTNDSNIHDEIVARAPEEALTAAERAELTGCLRSCLPLFAGVYTGEEISRLRALARSERTRALPPRDAHGLPHSIITLKTAEAFAHMVDADRNILTAILLYPLVENGALSVGEARRDWGDDIASMLEGLEKVGRFSGRNAAVSQENFRGLLLSLAEDIRVIIIMIVNRLVLMRSINRHPDDAWVRDVAFEANCLYAQLAHRLGLYKIKGELEDLSLKYTNRDIYVQIARKLNETKRERDAYIAAFIGPLREKLEAAGLKFDIKGRTKSISSIWAKMRKQKVDLQHIYDLFAIRVIIDTPLEREKADCWLAYSILGDMYTPNPARMRDWISIPKSNGYESLHATVMGPGSKWVEVQFRTRRMDLVAEKGLAAHWRYKGVKGDSTDRWMNNIRDILETADSGPMQLMRDMKMSDYEQEVYAFTPKGDLFRLPQGATVLDFAFQIHTKVGSQCTGAVVNGRHERINYRVCNGDTVEILTSASQSPKRDWLQIVTTSKARNKIRQSLNEDQLRKTALGKELFERRAKNRKVEVDEAVMMKVIKKMGYRHINDIFADMADEKVDPGKFLNRVVEAMRPEEETADTARVGAEEFVLRPDEERLPDSDVLVIGEKSIKGLSYKFAKCCNPINGDNVFGFISSDGVVKIHRNDCPNAANIRERYPYRLINVRWNGESGAQLPVTLRIVGQDDIGIVTNITSIITKEPDMSLRNISIDSHDGLFHGYLVINVRDTRQLSHLIRKLRTVKGVKDITR